MNDLIIGNISNGAELSINDVAIILGVTTEALKKHIREMYPGYMINGVETFLSESMVTEIKKRMMPTTKVVGNVTNLEMEEMTLKVIEFHSSERERLKKEIEEKDKKIIEMSPKVEYFEALCEAKDAVDIGTVAKILDVGIGKNRLFDILRKECVLQANNQPYQIYCDRGYFRIIESKYNKPDGSIHIGLKTVVYQSGINFIRTLLKRKGYIQSQALAMVG
ncbi:MAG: hypothetical protein HGB12_03005 [Bacteroidetes bacterium]|nr:hypothetical protein [Bacteroidota bacterium]